jgi:hypothetical protein
MARGWIEGAALLVLLIVDCVFPGTPLCLWGLLSVLLVRGLIVSVVLIFFFLGGLPP